LKILITGHLGFIAKHFIKELSDHDLSFYEWGETFPNLKGLDWVIHCGAISSTTEQDIDKIKKQNFEFSCWLLQQCIQYSVNLQYSSSASVYGLNKEFKETSPVDPRTPYAWSKYLFEQIALNTKAPILVQGFRYFNVYGSGEGHKGKQASPYTQFKQQAQKNGVITVFDTNACRDFICVNDVVTTQIKFLNINQNGIWNIGTGTTRSFISIAQDIAKEYDAKIKIVPLPKVLEQSYQTYTCADMSKTKKALEIC